MRTVVVKAYVDPNAPPEEYGRAWLDQNGEAVLRGFPDFVREQFETEGVYDASTGGLCPKTEGDRFLDLLLEQFSGSRVVAEEEPQKGGIDATDDE